MKYIFKLLTLIFVTFLLFSCDPSRDINFINETESRVEIKVKISPNITNERLKEVAKGDSIVLDLEPKATGYIYCGMGTWSDAEVKEIANSIENIEIETEDVKTVYKTRKSITDILNDNRKGLWWKTNVEIKVD